MNDMSEPSAKSTLHTADIIRVLKLLPHRYPFLMLDRIYDMDGDASCVGVKNVTINVENLAKLDPADQERVLAIRDRLEEITAMDRGALTRSERKELRAEVKELTKQADHFNTLAGGSTIYISTAGLIIIILLLIILL